MSCNKPVRGRREDDRNGILRNVGADVSPVTLIMVHPDCDATCRIGISRSIAVLSRHRDRSRYGGASEVAHRKGIFRSVGRSRYRAREFGCRPSRLRCGISRSSCRAGRFRCPSFGLSRCIRHERWNRFGISLCLRAVTREDRHHCYDTWSAMPERFGLSRLIARVLIRGARRRVSSPWPRVAKLRVFPIEPHCGRR